MALLPLLLLLLPVSAGRIDDSGREARAAAEGLGDEGGHVASSALATTARHRQMHQRVATNPPCTESIKKLNIRNMHLWAPGYTMRGVLDATAAQGGSQPQ